MASNLGATPIQTEFRAQGTRQIWVSCFSSQDGVRSFLTRSIVCALHPVLHQLPACPCHPALPHGSGPDGDLDYGVLRLDCRYLRSRWRSGTDLVQVGLLCLRRVRLLLHLVSLA